MRIFAHDFSGHPFQAQLSRELRARGHHVTHSYCAAYTSGRGHLVGGEGLEIAVIGEGFEITKMSFVRRLAQEVRLGLELSRAVVRARPDVVLMCNAPVPTMSLAVLTMWVRRIPWVYWHQDVVATALHSFARGPLGRAFHLVALVLGLGERWCARRATSIVAISDRFLSVHRRWGTADKVTVIPNWAPVDEIEPRPRDNDWARAHGLGDEPVLLYSGTLGLKHRPALLADLAHALRRHGRPARLVVVNEGPAVALVERRAAELGEPCLVLPYQPYAELPDVLGSADVLVVLLEPDASRFSVPSKTLTYLCAGRPVVGLMPADNDAATLIERAGGLVVAPTSSGVEEAAVWVAEVVADPCVSESIGRKARALAEEEFGIVETVDRFERLLAAAAGIVTADAHGVVAAQGLSHGEGHDYDAGSPHLRHASIRSALDDRVGALVGRLRVENGRCRVLEVGAGHGSITTSLLAAGAEVTVTEVSRHSADALRRRFADDPRVTVLHDPTGDAALATGEYEAVVMVSVLHHIPDYVAFVSRAVERVVPGGAFFSVQDPLWYPRVPRWTHAADRTAFYAWRLGQGELRRGLATVTRRLQGRYDESEPSDLVEYHVVRQGVDEVRLRETLERSFANVELWTYWSTQSALLQRWGERTSLRTEFGLTAVGKGRSAPPP